MAEPTCWHIDVPFTRIDDVPWRIRVLEFSGKRPGPATAVLSGITGDKPLGLLAMHDPDLVELNRRFPGSPRGLLSDQMAHALFSALAARVSAIIDVHSGTAMRTTEYIYDYGNLSLTASFGYLPVMVDRAIPGQLCTAASAAGIEAALVEFGGPDRNGTATAVAGCLNMLRFRGHLDDQPTGPSTVAIIDRVKSVIASTDGILESPYGPAEVGKPVAPGVFAWITNAITGERLETFEVEAIGSEAGQGPGFEGRAGVAPRAFTVESPPLLLLAQTVPSLVRPGNLLFIVGWVGRTIATPRRS